MGAFMTTPVFVNKENRTVVSGSHVVRFNPKMTGEKVKTVNGKCYIDGFELVDGKWEKTFMAQWYKVFGKKAE